jgi:hypothetical protein
VLDHGVDICDGLLVVLVQNRILELFRLVGAEEELRGTYQNGFGDERDHARIEAESLVDHGPAGVVSGVERVILAVLADEECDNSVAIPDDVTAVLQSRNCVLLVQLQRK